MKKKLMLCAAFMLAFAGNMMAEEKTKSEDVIKLNQVGYYPQQEKVIVVEGTKVGSVSVLDANGKKVLTAKRMAVTVSPISGKKRSTFNLSSLSKEGTYTVVAGKDKVRMIVAANALDALGAAAIKSFYYQRTAMPIEAKYAGKWARPAGHMDNIVEIHPAAASDMRPAGTIVSSPKGWYDAGDYNKYVVNSAFSMGLMLSMYMMLFLNILMLKRWKYQRIATLHRIFSMRICGILTGFSPCKTMMAAYITSLQRLISKASLCQKSVSRSDI